MTTVLKLVDSLSASSLGLDKTSHVGPAAADRRVLIRVPDLQAAAVQRTSAAEEEEEAVDSDQLSQAWQVGQAVADRLPGRAKLVALTVVVLATCASRMKRLPPKLRWAAATIVTLATAFFMLNSRGGPNNNGRERADWEGGRNRARQQSTLDGAPKSADAVASRQGAATIAPSVIQAEPWPTTNTITPPGLSADSTISKTATPVTDWDSDCPSTRWPIPGTPAAKMIEGDQNSYFDVRHNGGANDAPPALGEPPVARLEGTIATPRLK